MVVSRRTGCAWWVATVLAHGEAEPEAVLRRVIEAERFYAQRETTARFQISPHACSQALDPLLAERGYRPESPMSLRVAATSQVIERCPSGPLSVEVADHPTPSWFGTWHAVLGQGIDARCELALLERAEQPSAYARATIDGAVVAVGRAVADGGRAGVFSMATLPRARRRGAARTLLAAWAAWAADHRSHRMYLQVECDNLAALRLYEQAGFTELAGYHYRSAG